MAFIEWTERLSVNIDSIDRQHRTLINYINKVDEAVKKGSEEQVMNTVVKGLVQYTEAHFGYEEMLFKMHNYPETADHKVAHTKLFGKVEEFKARFDHGERDIGPEMLEFLKNWLNNHILKEDIAYSQYFIERGVK